jgi:hypothetical protein
MVEIGAGKKLAPRSDTEIVPITVLVKHFVGPLSQTQTGVR